MERLFTKLLLLLTLLLTTIIASAQCGADEKELVVYYSTDFNPEETSWTITDFEGNVYFERDYSTDTLYNIYIPNTYYDYVLFYDIFSPDSVLSIYWHSNILTDTICVPADLCLNMNIADSYNDGICCAHGPGFYTLYLDGDSLFTGGNFFIDETTTFNCPTGGDCTTAGVVPDTGAYTANLPNEFFYFTPQETGLYEIATCYPTNACPTAIWIYDDCVGTDVSEAEGFLDFASDGCTDFADQTVMSIGLEGGITYLVRIGVYTLDCTESMVDWDITFIGPIAGCMDATACNFNPIATIDIGCLYPGDPNCPAGPDLTVMSDVSANTMYMAIAENDDECFINEGCMTGYGDRELLIFDTRIENIGDVDWFVGKQPASGEESGDFWEFAPCHNHWHYKGYAEYLLYDADGNEIPAGFKAGFCVQDSNCGLGGGTAKYNCGYQGLSAGCGDIYPGTSDLYNAWDCQWLDVTDVSDGLYTVVIRVNWNQAADQAGRIETDYANNWGQVCVELSTTANGIREVDVLTNCMPFVDCLGDIYGDAQLDCLGACDGSAIRGDINGDAVRDLADINAYADAILNNAAYSPCTDLNNDEVLDVKDLAMLLPCVLEQDSLIEANDYCDLPLAIFNPFDTAYFSFGEIDFINNKIQIINNNEIPMLGLQFNVQGMEMTNVSIGELGSVFHNENKALAIAFGPEGFVIDDLIDVFKLEVFYEDEPFLGSEICLTDIRVLNPDRETITAIVDQCLDLTPFYDCAGILDGGADFDCAGNCGGTAVFGDIDGNNALEENDINTYLTEILNTASAASCYDLNDNELVDVQDAVLAYNCLNGEATDCDFPKVLEISVGNGSLLLYEVFGGDTSRFRLEVNTESVVLGGYHVRLQSESPPISIDNTDQFQYKYDYPFLDIIGVNTNNESSINLTFLNNQVDTICIAEVIEIVDIEGKSINTTIGSPNCGITTSIQDQILPKNSVFPNPFSNQTTFYFENNVPQNLTIYNTNGGIVRQYDGINDKNLTFDASNLPSGIYFYSIDGVVLSNNKLVIY